MPRNNEFQLLSINKLMDKVEHYDYKDLFYRNIWEELLELKFPFVKGHGDLRKANILLSNKNNKIYYIDWELSQPFIIFYDLFFLMYHEAVYSQNYLILDDYFKGRYDNYLHNISELCGIEYKKCTNWTT